MLVVMVTQIIALSPGKKNNSLKLPVGINYTSILRSAVAFPLFPQAVMMGHEAPSGAPAQFPFPHRSEGPQNIYLAELIEVI